MTLALALALSLLLSGRGVGGDATVTICHSRSADLAEHARRADILVSAVGQPALVKADMVKPGAAVIDVGINRVASASGGTRLVGDVDFDAVREVAGCLAAFSTCEAKMTSFILAPSTTAVKNMAAVTKTTWFLSLS